MEIEPKIYPKYPKFACSFDLPPSKFINFSSEIHRNPLASPCIKVREAKVGKNVHQVRGCHTQGWCFWWHLCATWTQMHLFFGMAQGMAQWMAVGLCLEVSFYLKSATGRAVGQFCITILITMTFTPRLYPMSSDVIPSVVLSVSCQVDGHIM